MSNSDFQILQEIYRFLAQFKAETLAAAARRRATSENIRVALNALAREASDKGGLHLQSSAGTRKGGRTVGEKLSLELSQKEYRTNLRSFLLDERKFPDKMTLAQFAKTLGIPEAAPPKFSRERVAHRIAQYALKDESFRRRLYELLVNHDAGDAQTKGWMNLILRDR